MQQDRPAALLGERHSCAQIDYKSAARCLIQRVPYLLKWRKV